MREESSTSGPVLFCAFIVCICTYWPIHLAVETLLKRYQPDFYRRLEQEIRAKKLAPVLTMLVRVFLGVSITLPSCLYAAYTTPAGLNQPLNVPGQMCMATQATVWVVEIPIMLEYSMELAIHHIICLLVLANSALSPTIHQAKPLYIYFASQLGDIGPSSVLITKMSGRTPQNSWLMYSVSLASTMWLGFGKVGATITTLALALENPYRIQDWVWAVCLLFFSVYSLFYVFKGLAWVGIITPDRRNPRRFIVLKKLVVPVGHVWMGIGLAVSFIVTTFVYCLYSRQVVKSSELWDMAFQGLVAACLGMTSSIIMAYSLRMISRTECLEGNLDLQFGIICAGAWISSISSYARGIHRETLLASVGFSLPIFEALMNIGSSYGIVERCKATVVPYQICRPVGKTWVERLLTGTLRTRKTEPVRDDKSSESSSSSGDEAPRKQRFVKTVHPSIALGNVMAQAHLGVACSNLAVFAASVAVLSFDLLSLEDTAKMAASAMVMTQLLHFPVLEFFWVACAAALMWEDDSWSQIWAELGGMALTAAMARYMDHVFAQNKDVTRVPKAKSPEEVPKKWRVLTCTNFTFLLAVLLQGIMAREVLLNPDYSSVEETPQGWKNFRSAIGCPYMWVSAAFLVSLPSLGFNALRLVG